MVPELPADLLEILRCPKCLGVLATDVAEGLACRACKLVYPVVEGVPDFLVEDAKPLEAR